MQVVAKLEAGGIVMDVVVEDFNKIQLFDDAKNVYGKIVDGFYELVDEFCDVAKSVKFDDFFGVAKTLQGIITSFGVEEIQAVEVELKVNGYKFDD